MTMLKAIIFLSALSISADAFAQSCIYSTYKWNTHSRKAVDFRQINKPYNKLDASERDTLTGSTVCEEDQ